MTGSKGLAANGLHCEPILSEVCAENGRLEFKGHFRLATSGLDFNNVGTILQVALCGLFDTTLF